MCDCASQPFWREWARNLISLFQAGPERCALAVNATTAGKLNTRIRGAIAELYASPLPVPHANRPGVLTAQAVSCTYSRPAPIPHFKDS